METEESRYREMVAAVKFREYPVSELSSRQYKWNKLKSDWKLRRQQIKTNAMFGAGIGAALGIIFSVPSVVKHRQISILLASTLVSSLSFASICGFGALVH